MKRVFVCSPFRGDVVRNTELARQYCRYVLLQGFAPFAPHLLYTQMLDDNAVHEREQGILAGIAWLEACDEIWVFGEPSEGMRKEISLAEAIGKPIIKLSPLAIEQAIEEKTLNSRF